MRPPETRLPPPLRMAGVLAIAAKANGAKLARFAGHESHATKLGRAAMLATSSTSARARASP